MILLQRCLICSASATIKKIIKTGSALIVKLKCQNGHEKIWRSQPLRNRLYEGNIKIAAGILFSTNTYIKLHKFFNLAGIHGISKQTYYRIYDKYLRGVVNDRWIREKTFILDSLKQRKSILLSGDGRCDSPGHNAKYLTYSFLDQSTGKIATLSLTQVTEAGNSNRMELIGFKKDLKIE